MGWLCYEIKICSYDDDYNHKEIKGKKSMTINDCEYRLLKKVLQKEYGVMHEFEELDKESKEVLSDNAQIRK
tara:strand:- start:185 stop:400 length:216 start_codon:yes stop_codon:yes gene_type:complete